MHAFDPLGYLTLLAIPKAERGRRRGRRPYQQPHMDPTFVLSVHYGSQF